MTRKCRFKCIHCRAGAADDAMLTQLSTSQCKRILKSVSEYCKAMIIMTGGEPLERADFFELADYARQCGLPTALATCGYLMDDSVVAKVKEAGIGAISFSLDGASPVTHDKFRQTAGAFDAVVRAAGLVREAGIRFQINMTITKDNVSEIAEIADFARRLGAACFNAFILVPTGRGEQIQTQLLSPVQYHAVLRQLLELKRSRIIDVRVTCGPQFARIARQEKVEDAHKVKGCLGGREFGFISYKGDVQMCGFMNISAGNIVENGFDFAAIWEKSEFLKEIRDTGSYQGNCGSCEFTGVCGGCRARSYSMLSNYLATDPICDYQPGAK